MKKRALIFVFLFSCLNQQQLPYPLMMPYNNGSYDSFWDGPNGQKGFWGHYPTNKTNIFNTSWNKKGYKQIYNMNSMAPFSQDRMTGYDSMVPYYTPLANSIQNYYPVDKQYETDGQINPNTRDLNSRKYASIYRQYFYFYNKNLDRLKNLYNDNAPLGDLNNDHQRKKKYPKTFIYGDYFDGFPEKKSLYGAHLNTISHKINESRDKSRYLMETNNTKSKINHVYNIDKINNLSKIITQEEETQKKLNENQKQIQKLSQTMKKLQKMVDEEEKQVMPVKVVYSTPEKKKSNQNLIL